MTDWSLYKSARNHVKMMLIQAEIAHVQGEINNHKGNTGSMWKTIRKCLPSKLTTRLTYSKDQDRLTNEFNEYFTSVRQKAADATSNLLANINSINSAMSNDIIPNSISFCFRPATTFEVRKIIFACHPTNLPDPSKYLCGL